MLGAILRAIAFKVWLEHRGHRLSGVHEILNIKTVQPEVSTSITSFYGPV